MRNIDPARKLLYVLTPVPLETLHRVNTLLKGILEIPAALMLSVSTDYDLPFFLVDKKNTATSFAVFVFVCFCFFLLLLFVVCFCFFRAYISRRYFIIPRLHLVLILGLDKFYM